MAYPMQNYNTQNDINPFSFKTFTPPNNQSWWEQFFFGIPESYMQIPRYGQQGMDTLSQLLSGGLNQLQNPYSGFEDIANYTNQQFFQNILPQLSERFATTGGAASSPSFATQVGQAAGPGLAGLLGQQRAQYGMQNRQQGLQQAQLGLTQPYDIIGQERRPGFPEQLFNNVNQNIGTAAKMLPFLL